MRVESSSMTGWAKQQVKRLLRTRYPLECPLCGYCDDLFYTFAPDGRPARQNAVCPQCHSLERHRLLWRFLDRRTNLLTSSTARLLHLAPEPHLGTRLRQRLLHYVSLDLESPAANIHADLTHLPFADRAFDAILCSHVLEHVRDDLAAMLECRRVLTCGGCALFLVPLNESALTDEDPTVTDTDERIQRFGQADHVRFYGLDIMDRLRTAGFSVGRVTLESVYQDGDRDLALGEAVGGIFFCTIPAGQPRV